MKKTRLKTTVMTKPERSLRNQIVAQTSIFDVPETYKEIAGRPERVILYVKATKNLKLHYKQNYDAEALVGYADAD